MRECPVGVAVMSALEVDGLKRDLGGRGWEGRTCVYVLGCALAKVRTLRYYSRRESFKTPRTFRNRGRVDSGMMVW